MESMLEKVWANCLAIIKDNVLDTTYATWFEPIKPVRLVENVLTIQVPSQFFYEWLEEHYVTLMHKTIKRELGPNARLEYSIVMDKNSQSNQPGLTINLPAQGARSKNPEVSMPVNIGNTIRDPYIIPGLRKVQVDSQLNPQYTFDNFIEGDCNRLARSAGIAVSNKPGGTAFNPLMIYGGVGLGKSHLLHAIGNQIRTNFSQKTVLYITVLNFMNHYVDAMRRNSLHEFDQFYQLVDVLLVDDIQYLEGKEKMQENFFQIFNNLHQSGKQIVMASDRPPKDLKGLDDRLLSRFKWGLTADLQMPEFETRLAILELKMYNDGIKLPHEVVEFVAYNVKSNIRELEGALISILANASLNQKQVDLDLARSVMKNLVSEINSEITPESIQAQVCSFYNLSVQDLMSKSRKREVVQARQISMYFTKMYTKHSLKSIGELFGGRDHSTVIHSCNTVEDLIQTDRRIKNEVEEIGKRIKLNLS